KSEAGEQTIEARKKGVVANMPDSTGGRVSNEEPFAMIIDIDDIKIQATATQKMRDLFKTDQEVTVEIDNEDYTGEVMALDPLPSEKCEYELNLKRDEQEQKIKKSDSTKISGANTNAINVLIVPSVAIITKED